MPQRHQHVVEGGIVGVDIVDEGCCVVDPLQYIVYDSLIGGLAIAESVASDAHFVQTSWCHEGSFRAVLFSNGYCPVCTRHVHFAKVG